MPLPLLLEVDRPDDIPSHKLTFKLEVAREGMKRSEVPTSDDMEELLEYVLGLLLENPKLLVE